MKKYNQVALIILSGWGVAPPHESNVLSVAELPQFRRLIKEYPTALLKPVNFEPDILSYKYTSPELASLSLGTGKNHFQVIPWVDKKLSDKDFFENEVLKKIVLQVKQHNSKIHLIGLLGEGRINASQKHLYTLLDYFSHNKCQEVLVHGILDGKDEPDKSGLKYVEGLEEKFKEIKKGEIASLSGRYFAMDRGNYWDRTKESYDAIFGYKNKLKGSALDYLKTNYQNQIFDFDIKPAGFGDARITDEDVVIFFNSRPDYIRQLAESIFLPSFAKFDRVFNPRELFSSTLIQYENEFPALPILKENFIDYSLSKVLSNEGFKQVKISEVDRYPHITYHFNGLSEEPFKDEEWQLVRHKELDNYGKKTLVDKLGFEAVKYIDNNDYNFVVVNFSSADLKSRSGKFKEIIEEAEKTDKALGRVIDYCLARNAAAIITSDCGNIEQMVDIKTGIQDLGPNNNPVPAILVSNDYRGLAGPAGDPLDSDLSLLRSSGTLANIAPTILNLFGLKKPEQMSGNSIF